MIAKSRPQASGHDLLDCPPTPKKKKKMTALCTTVHPLWYKIVLVGLMSHKLQSSVSLFWLSGFSNFYCDNSHGFFLPVLCHKTGIPNFPYVGPIYIYIYITLLFHLPGFLFFLLFYPSCSDYELPKDLVITQGFSKPVSAYLHVESTTWWALFLIVSITFPWPLLLALYPFLFYQLTMNLY